MINSRKGADQRRLKYESGQLSFQHESHHVIIDNLLVLLLSVEQAVSAGFVDKSWTAARIFKDLRHCSVREDLSRRTSKAKVLHNV